MSFELYLQSLTHGDYAGISRERVREVFGVHLAEKETDFWQVRYDDLNSCDVYLTPASPQTDLIERFMVHRPCEDRRLWDALAAILVKEDAMLYFPGCRAPLIGRSDAVEHVPWVFIEVLGTPIFVTTGEEIRRAVETA